MPTPIRTLVKEYQKRLQHYGGVELIEVAESKRNSDTPALKLQNLVQEAKRLRDRIPPQALLVPLDAKGKNLTSLQLAETIENWKMESVDTVCFIIGGPDGLNSELLKQAPWRLSLGSMTYPHMLARVLILEQIYRAHTILNRVPYHR